MKVDVRFMQVRSFWCRSVLAFLVVVMGILLAAPFAGAQGIGGRIRGTVTDPSGGAVATATVTLINEATHATRSVQSGASGEYIFIEVPVGTYEIDAAIQGFKKYVRKGIALDLNQVITVDIALQIGAASESIEVTGAPPVIDTTTTQLGAVMTDKSVRELPLNTRNTYQLLQLQPGVQSQLGADLFYGSDNPGVVSVNGGRGRSNNYMVNGGDGNDIFVNAPAIQPSPDAIDEFRILTNTFDAEYGRNSGSVVNVVTKSGTNQVHGDVYEFFRNKVLNTKGFFNNTVPDYKQNQFGGTLGGPIKKDKTFIFGSYEGDRIRKGISSGTLFLPTALEAGGDFSAADATGTASAPFTGVVTDPNVASVLNSRAGCATAVAATGGAPITAGAAYSAIFPNNKIPTACFDPTALAVYNKWVAPSGTGAVTFAPNQKNRTDQFTTRFDHAINAAQRFSVYYYFEDDNRQDPFSSFQGSGADMLGFGSLFKTRVQQWNVSHTWTIGSTAVNEFRFNYFREGQLNLDHPLTILSGPNGLHDACGSAVPASNCFADPNNPSIGITTNIPGRVGVPFISTAGGFSIGNNINGELPQIGNTFQWSDNYSKIIGRHALKFGGDVRRQRFDQFLYYNINGDFSFQSNAASPSGNDTGFINAYPNYFLGLPTTYSQGAAQGEDIRNTALYLFAQDSWKIKTNLTLNYGLRWELNTPYIDTKNRIETFRPGQVTTQYPCWLSASSAAALGTTPGDCGQNSANNAYFPLGLVFPGDAGVPQGLTSTYYKAFAPRIGLAWSPGWKDGWLAKLTGGPGKSTIRGGYGMFYNPIEQLVLEQFSAEPPFGVSTFLSNTLFNTPYEAQNGSIAPNNAVGIIQQTPSTPCFDPAGPKGCVDWSLFRPDLLFGEFQPHLRTQYSEQYNLTIERQLSKDILLRVAYVGTQAHRLLGSHDLNYGNTQTCLDLAALGQGCTTFSADSPYSFTLPQGQVFHLPYAPGGPNGGNIPCPYGVTVPSACTITGAAGGTPITLVGIRPYSSPNCNPLTGNGCPADGVPLFSNIFAEDTMANSNYNALQVSLEKHYSHGLLFQASYTFSKAIDQGASFENELNPINFRATRGVSLLDAKHRFVFSPVWDLPIKERPGFTGKLIAGWGVSAILTYQSGFPIRVQDANDAELQSSFFFEDTNTPQITGPIRFLNPKTNGGLWFDTSNITDPVPGTFGNMPHALCCGPAISNTDLVISKKTRINERWNTEFRAEFYNAWNHTQFTNPDGNFTNSTFGLIQKARDPRLIQFGLKILF